MVSSQPPPHPNHLYISSRMNIGLASALSLVCCGALAMGAPSLALLLASNLLSRPRPRSVVHHDASCCSSGASITGSSQVCRRSTLAGRLPPCHTSSCRSPFCTFPQPPHAPNSVDARLGVPCRACLENLPPHYAAARSPISFPLNYRFPSPPKVSDSVALRERNQASPESRFDR